LMIKSYKKGVADCFVNKSSKAEVAQLPPPPKADKQGGPAYGRG
jgi:hypothetical protein